jgi:hypothetical protein
VTLADVRKLSIQKHLQVHFKLRNGMECVVSEHGVAQVPGLKGKPDFNLEEELANAAEFLLEPIFTDEKARKNGPRPRTVKREEVAAMLSAAPAAAAHVDHDDE